VAISGNIFIKISVISKTTLRKITFGGD